MMLNITIAVAMVISAVAVYLFFVFGLFVVMFSGFLISILFRFTLSIVPM
jgi:hypothetical protein